MSNKKMTILASILEYRERKNSWTQTEFGAKIGVNSSVVSRIGNGTKQISSKKLQVFSEALLVDISEISELYFAYKFAKEMIEYNFPQSILIVAEQAIKYIKFQSSKHLKLDTI